MRQPYYNYPNDEPHFDEYHLGCHPHHPHPYHDKVGVVGRLVLSVKYIDHHGHVKYFDITPGETYVIEAISQTKGKCKFAGRIVDFKSQRGTEKVLQPPHTIDIDSIIVDYSDDYESRLIEIGIKNIISINPIERVEAVNPEEYHHEEYFIDDPFADQKLQYATEQAENSTY